MSSPSVLITGASSGIGESCARHLASRGFCVYAGVRSDAAAEALNGLKNLTPVRLDVTKPEDWQAVSALLKREGRGLSGLVNNAGAGFGGPIEHLDLQAFRDQFEVNFFGVIQGIQICLPHLRQAKGRIINVSSVNGRVVTPFLSPYCSSKFALEALSESLRYELSPWGLHVSLIQPGMIRTPIFLKSQSRFKELLAALPESAREQYAGPLASFQGLLERAPQKGADPILVARVVEKALTEASPRLRYAVGTDARIGLLLRKFLSDRTFESLIKRLAVGKN